jgi:hypothetical protein
MGWEEWKGIKKTEFRRWSMKANKKFDFPNKKYQKHSH